MHVLAEPLVGGYLGSKYKDAEDLAERDEGREGVGGRRLLRLVHHGLEHIRREEHGDDPGGNGGWNAVVGRRRGDPGDPGDDDDGNEEL